MHVQRISMVLSPSEKEVGMKRLAILVLLVLSSCWVQAQEPLIIAAGAGYKKPLLALYKLFTQTRGIGVTPVFGNMRTVIAQSEASDRVALAVGDRGILSVTGLYDEMIELGRGRLVLAWAGKPPEQGIDALLEESLGPIAMPDPKKAIYGRAAEQFLINSGLRERLASRLLVLATVPQVSSHLVAGSVEVGFINLTNALALHGRIGGVTELPADRYEPIQIVAAVVKGHSARDEVRQFIDFLASPESRDILREAGL
jgi:molybdate transport system substrate-binding protein